MPQRQILPLKQLTGNTPPGTDIPSAGASSHNSQICVFVFLFLETRKHEREKRAEVVSISPRPGPMKTRKWDQRAKLSFQPSSTLVKDKEPPQQLRVEGSSWGWGWGQFAQRAEQHGRATKSESHMSRNQYNNHHDNNNGLGTLIPPLPCDLGQIG